ncbi:hypothetical protein N8H74_03225 [Pseudomonas sp. B2M1-30]|uniref:hypothetical protein n=1 Tax=Pseudomonas TaxID=286 RepID=UPI0021CA2807|nr:MULTISPECIES: hypothetical protein [Pseudomonas]MCU0117253.1 hypothetical protein [Pseudomonas sp. B2M1-30]MCU7260647.1 hypothetical protein [Pseudomonas koreensis]
MTISIEESGMIFGPFPEEKLFPIETSPLSKRLGEGIKVTEFVLLRDLPGRPVEAWFIEAKSSAPRQTANFVEEIRQKFTNSVQLTLASCLRRHDHSEELLPVGFLNLDLGSCALKCVLVINNFPKEWMVDLQSALNKAMNSMAKTLGLKPGSTIVINDEMARMRNLIR